MALQHRRARELKNTQRFAPTAARANNCICLQMLFAVEVRAVQQLPARDAKTWNGYELMRQQQR